MRCKPMRIASLPQVGTSPSSAKTETVKPPVSLRSVSKAPSNADVFEPGVGNGGVQPGGDGSGPGFHPKPRPTVTLPEPSPIDNTFPYQIWVNPKTGLPLPVFDGTTDLGREVCQGTLGDCYLAASVSELAERRPDLIAN